MEAFVLQLVLYLLEDYFLILCLLGLPHLVHSAWAVVHDPGSLNCAMYVRYICTQYQ